ncbi:MAG: hypothetical protein A3J37_07060 [Alphaproteobacteria bacterium RIFCSPHIGHO2_12_FULL_45_9]|nr:MAG: hypothetical protein A3B66_00910 [Alphaproteobacteria bacterium RIFCSPHIGHO2_02_FULL_46_13]OFW96446.1 MAG: hypothetical protein A3J37_07060 [Alphaproteobacteria bacterium RIFCSPHIGHO2_12_FULL_45_9]
MRVIELKTVFNQLIGTWSLHRDIFDAAGHSNLVGTCVFSVLDDNRILCEENGILNYNGNQTEASRSYIYEYRDDKITILYNDAHRAGDVLHELKFMTEGQNQVARHCHYCGADTYDIEFNLLPDGKIQMNYVVKGPHKDYQMRTTLTPK